MRPRQEYVRKTREDTNDVEVTRSVMIFEDKEGRDIDGNGAEEADFAL